MTKDEFTEFLQNRILKRIEQNPTKDPLCVGAIVVPLKWLDTGDIVSVECCRCGIPIYITRWTYNLMKDRHLPGYENIQPFFCEFCIPPSITKGVLTQDLAAVLQHIGEQ